MPELREKTEWTAKGIHPHTPPYTPIARLVDLSGRQGTGVDWMCVLLLCLLLCIGIGHLLSSFFLRHATTNKQTRRKQTRGGRLPNSIAITITHCLSAGLQSAAVILGSVAFSVPISQGASQNLDRERRAHTCVRVRAVHSPVRNKQNSLSPPRNRTQARGHPPTLKYLRARPVNMKRIQ